jgi:hypothetical protein
MHGLSAIVARGTYRFSVALVPSRTDLPKLLNSKGLLGCGVEIGVQTGAFSEFLLTNWKGLHLISIDPWREATDVYRDVANVSQKKQEQLYEEAVRRLGRHGARSTIWRLTSAEAGSLVPSHSLDFAYLDARHDYESVKNDLFLWFEKIRPGGIFAGHDYFDGERPEGTFRVASAVNDFFAMRDIPVASTFQDSPWDSWIAQIPLPGRTGTDVAWRFASSLRDLLVILRSVRDRSSSQLGR